MKPQRPGDVLLWEEYTYLIVPTRPGDPPNYVEAVRKAGSGPLRLASPGFSMSIPQPDAAPYSSVRLASSDLVRVESLEHFAQVVHGAALQCVRRFAAHSDYLPRIPEAVVVILDAVKAHVVAGRSVWYAADRLFANPGRMAVTVGG